MNEPTLKNYIVGFAASLALTFAAYALVVWHSFAVWPLVVIILALAVVQLVVQLVFFLRLGFGTGERWRMAIFLSAVSLVLIIVIGSVWIMNHLNYNMTPSQINQYMQDESTF